MRHQVRTVWSVAQLEEIVRGCGRDGGVERHLSAICTVLGAVNVRFVAEKRAEALLRRRHQIDEVGRVDEVRSSPPRSNRRALREYLLRRTFTIEGFAVPARAG